MYLSERPRRLRRNETLRRMVRETRLSADNLVFPLFVRDEAHACRPISSMPGQFQWGIAEVADQAAKAADAGVPAVLLFGIPERKDAEGSSAWEDSAVVCRSGSHQKRCPSSALSPTYASVKHRPRPLRYLVSEPGRPHGCVERCDRQLSSRKRLPMRTPAQTWSRLPI